jgi:transcriptional regulator with XRE-family HTH domain
MAKHGKFRAAVSSKPISLAMRRDLGQKLREARKTTGLSQRQLAKLTGIHHAHISEIENGLQNVTFDTVTVLARAVGLEAQILLSPTPRKGT